MARKTTKTDKPTKVHRSRGKQQTFWITDTERRLLKRKAERRGLSSVADYIRTRCGLSVAQKTVAAS